MLRLEFGKRVGQPKANISTKFCEDPTKIIVVINNYSINIDRCVDWPTG